MKALCSLLLALGAWSFFGLVSLAADSLDPSLHPSALGYEAGEFGFVNSLPPLGELLSNGTFEDFKGQDKSPAAQLVEARSSQSILAFLMERKSVSTKSVTVKPIAETKDLNFAFPLLFVMLAGAIRLFFRSDAYKEFCKKVLGPLDQY